MTLWVALDLLPPRALDPPAPTRLRRAIGALLALAFLTALAGAFVAGLRGGLVYNTFPLMNGYVVAPDFAELSPWYRNFFENPVAAQFDHRVLAELTWLVAVVLWLYARRLGVDRPLRRALDAVLLIATLQAALGIATLLLAVPIPVALLHQAGALLLLTALLVARHRARPLAVGASPAL